MLSDKTFLILNADEAMGQTLATGLAQAGARSILIGKHQPTLEALSDEIAKKQGPLPLLHPQDLSLATPEQLQAMCDGFYEHCDKLDGLLCHYATPQALTPLRNQTFGAFAQHLQGALISTCYLIQQCLPLLGKARQAHLLYHRLPQAFAPFPYFGAHAVACQGMQAFLEILKAEQSEAATVVIETLDIGVIETPDWRHICPGRTLPETVAGETIFATYLERLCEHEIG